MNKNRVEAFSDGVFAIAITLLVLDVRLPEADIQSNAQLYSMLVSSTVSIITFIFSFLVIGIFWIAHHRIFDLVHKVNHRLLWSNVFYLMTVALIPFPASVLAHHPFLTTSIVFYSAVLLLCGLQHFLLLVYIYRHKELQLLPLTYKEMKQYLMIAAAGPLCYLVAIIGSLINSFLSFFMILFAIIFYIFLVPVFLTPAKTPGEKGGRP